ncbi:MAG: TipAS antibiotic-recognition domain-containing protein [Oscillospiraceae bacterium]|nr:TipAS antibiotic-recognition domain-containing protein [Oscillospiraceae bacterium]
MSNKKIKGMREEQWQKSQELSAEINETLKTALKFGDPDSEMAQKACDLHRQWLCMFWEDGTYSKKAHKGLAETYVADERFKKYYDAIADGAAVFLRDSIIIYCQE